MKKLYWVCVLAAGLSLAACSNDDDDAFLTVKSGDVELTFKNLDKWVAATEQAADRIETKLAALEQQGVDPELIEALKGKLAALRQALQEVMAHPSDQTFAAALQAWEDLRSAFEAQQG